MTETPRNILLNKYRIERLLGRGAFGDVYLITHMALNVPRALKVLRRDAPGIGSTEFDQGQLRFQLEAQLGAQLNTPTHTPTCCKFTTLNKLMAYSFWRWNMPLVAAY